MMSSLFNHVFIPLVILLLFSNKLRLNPRMVFALSFFAVLPDMDAIFFIHRASFHNIFVLIIAFIFFILAKNKKKVTPGIICFYLASHLLLDIFNGGIFLLYPVYDNVFFAHVELLFNSNHFTPVLDYGISKDIMNMGRGEPAISSENIGVTVLLIIFLVISAFLSLKKKLSSDLAQSSEIKSETTFDTKF